MKLQYEILLSEFMEMAWIRHRSSVRWIVGIGVGLIGLVVGILFYAYAEPVPGIFLAVLSTFLFLMQFVIPTFVFQRVYRRNSAMVGPRTVTISDIGITSDHQLGRSESSWNTYQKFKETERSFLLYHSPDLIGILPKRVFAGPEDLQEFRALLTAKVPQN